MAGPPRRWWHEMTTKEFAALDVERAVAVLPVAAVEQHGPHLPVWTDAGINQGIVARAVELMPAELPAVILPMLPVGKSDEHVDFPGTLSLSTATLAALWTDVAESVYRAGLRRIVFFNSHGGQPQVMELVTRDLRTRLGMLAVAASWYALDFPDGLFDADEERFGIHGGGIETSMMLHLFPGLVREAERRDFPSLAAAMARDGYRLLTPEGRIGFGWQTQDLNVEGACGDATDADAERGRLLVDHAARGLVELLAEVARFPLDAFDRAPQYCPPVGQRRP